MALEEMTVAPLAVMLCTTADTSSVHSRRACLSLSLALCGVLWLSYCEIWYSRVRL